MGDLASPIGKLSVHFIPDGMGAEDTVLLAQRVERLGYGALWVPEFLGREVFSHIAYLLSKTTTLTIASGIANIYARDARAMVAAQLALNEQFGDRFLLGLGVSHPQLVGEVRGHEYLKPVAAMRDYLEAMKVHEQSYGAPRPSRRPMTVLAALRPGMLRLASEMADGILPTWTPPEHTRRAREIVGDEKLIFVLQNVMLEADPAKARAAIRKHISMAMTLPAYRENLKWLGFSDDDFANGFSDRLVDAVVAWGDERAIRQRIEEHFASGADHVCIYPQSPSPDAMLAIDYDVVNLLAPCETQGS